ncbi:ScbA/BarX family gamma-butyrolactone biosynthesis protein [Streptomyces xanthochromogenes]|uniref:ScbA/BarX family gamma-butyrolactone biosynthesis protein n=1 Tax=Streptomyces xanthochromogenes TaxID=67384 RepID=UPI003440DE1E
MIEIDRDTHIQTTSTLLGHIPAPGRPDPAISAAFAHRAAAEDVLVAGWRRRSDTVFSIAVDWSKQHNFFAPARGSAHHHMLIAQTLRQIGLGLTHAGLDVAAGTNHFLLDDLRYSADPRHRTDTLAPVRAEAEYTWTGRRSLRVQISLQQGGTLFVTSSSHFTWVPDGVYRRLRGDYLTARPRAWATPVEPSVVGRHSPDEVTLADTGVPHRWELISDTGHPALIDHAVDHVPGLVLLEAAQQAAYAFAGSDGFNPLSTAIQAQRYVEFDAPCFVEARAIPAWSPGALAVEVTGIQRGEATFRCQIQGTPAHE